TVQTRRSVMELLAADDVEVTYVMREDFRDSGLTRAAFRAEGVYRPASSLEELRGGILDAVGAPSRRRRFVYAYFADLDVIGHVHGPGSPQWRESLREVDAVVTDLAADLPADCSLLLAADHGMVSAETVIDLDTLPELASDVELVAGEARVRHAYARPGAQADVLAAWSSVLGGRARVLTREQALDEKLFGAGSEHAARIGDVVAVATGGVVLVRSVSEPMESAMTGHQGATRPVDQHITLRIRWSSRTPAPPDAAGGGRRYRPDSAATHGPATRGAPMKAVTWHGERDVRVEDVPDPRIQEPTDAI